MRSDKNINTSFTGEFRRLFLDVGFSLFYVVGYKPNARRGERDENSNCTIEEERKWEYRLAFGYFGLGGRIENLQCDSNCIFDYSG